MTTYDVTILGAGASGLMAASHINAKYPQLKVCVVDGNSEVGAKIKVSGGAKCNITNKYLNSDKYLGDKNFIETILKSFNQYDLLKFCNENGLYPQINEKIVKGTYFCKSSLDVINMFKKLTTKCRFFLEHKALDIDFVNDLFVLTTTKQTIKSRFFIVASGGLSYTSLGASDIGLKIAKKFGHNITTPNPALVGFTVQKEQFWFKELSGLSIDDVEIKVDGKTCRGSMLFTHKGCSGPVILSTSLYWNKGQIGINFVPTNKSYLPKRFKQAIKNIDINLQDYKMSPAGNFGYSKAEVTKGGINISEINPTNMESKLKNNLFFIGELLEVTGELGGYNFQWAFSSAKKIILSV